MGSIDLIYQDESYRIIGAAMRVHRELGCGFVELVYQEAFEVELTDRGIPFCREAQIVVNYKGKPLKKAFIADFLCFDKIVVELKAVSCLEGIHEAQLFNYLKATGFKLGLLINFGLTSLDYKRIVR